ncbi:hypothetical protein MJO28_007753 [Puccinia striiformis f. sp. tritici]|uniref:Uncharacterized protein n=1 Tax=Puccinia striiformis f. sp. tritici TaxID=168172 RepID=A0ACC0EEZ3_9BASI|nr:hypothetical protein Pst134EA_013862 [Puccinia striiformis f. sp. tritici]KAH9466009.1 hypothetical protein Pst134EA_013862 [Puccinia striiformis f. sp. tritici]KAI7952069.1 hypothetical protein MJO28_007753 [Puccinia striiformis f. sp. tritici]
MPSSTQTDLRAPSDPEDHTTSGTTPQAEQKLPAMQSSSPTNQYVRPNDGGAASHQSRIHFHPKRPHASNENQLISSYYDSNLNPASQANGFLHTSHSNKRSSSQANETQRFSPYHNTQKIGLCLPKLSASLNPSDKCPKPRRRNVPSKPKYPKYEGLSNFAAPSDLVSDRIPGSYTNSLDQSSPPSSKSMSCLTPERMSLKDYGHSMTLDDGHTQEGSSIPIDFLKRLDFEEWDQRKQNLLQMVEDRKSLFLQGGFAETSGKPFLPDEKAIEKKPIPNRWVWYMHLSTDYDKANNTRVPAGGPAGYLKYGWDRLGVAGKQPYQELADIYSAQRLKFMAEHGIAEDTTKKKTKQSDKPKARNRKSQEVVAIGENFANQSHSPYNKMACPTESIDQTISSHVSNLHGNPSFLPLQPILQPNLFYEQYNRYPFEKPQYDYVDGSSEIFEMNEANSYSSYLQSPESIPSGFSPLGYEVTYGHRYNSDATTDYIGTPLGFPSSPTEYPFACNPSSTYSYQAASEFQTWSTLSPESINSVRSETVGVFPPPCMNNTPTSTANYNILTPSNAFMEPFNRHEMDLNVLHTGINY